MGTATTAPSDVQKILLLQEKPTPPPVVEPEISTPDEETSTPEEETSTPEEETSTPEEETSTPEEETSTPEEEASTPVEEASTPVEEASTPVEEATTPEEKPTHPNNSVEQSKKPTTNIGTIAAITIGAVVAVGTIGFIAYTLIKKKRKI